VRAKQHDEKLSEARVLQSAFGLNMHFTNTTRVWITTWKTQLESFINALLVLQSVSGVCFVVKRSRRVLNAARLFKVFRSFLDDVAHCSNPLKIRQNSQRDTNLSKTY